MRRLIAGLMSLGLVLACPSAGQAGSLRVAPTGLDLLAPARAGAITVRNDGKRPLDVQVRVFRWSEAGGRQLLVPTADVVASPPGVRLAPGAENIIRVVRLAREPVAGEESYRVLIDELPDPSLRRAGAVNLVLRHSVPAFFRSPDATPPEVAWTIERAGRSLSVKAVNAGERHLRVANLGLKDRAGRRVMLRSGLVGYVLGRAAAEWSFPAPAGMSLLGPVVVSAVGEAGEMNATASAR